MQNTALNPTSSASISTSTSTSAAAAAATASTAISTSATARTVDGNAITLSDLPAGGDSSLHVTTTRTQMVANNNSSASGSSNSSSSSSARTTTTNGYDVKHNGYTATSNNASGGDNGTQKNHDGGDGTDGGGGGGDVAITTKKNLHLNKSTQEIIRLIGQYLQDVGLDASVKTLMSESGCYLEHPAATKFREHILSGEWTKADADLKELEPLISNGKMSTTTITEMKFIILEQKYLEHLDDSLPLDALHVLRNELTPLQHNISRVHQLSSYMMCSTNHDLHLRAKWKGKGMVSRSIVMERLQSFMPPTIMMSPRRLNTLLQQAIKLQTEHCPCHNMAWETNIQNVSLLSDHCCATDGFPIQTIQVLTEHCDEVWFCKFSPDGLKLATGSKDATIIIYDVDPYKLTLKQSRVFDGQLSSSVSFVSWSPDSKLILVGGPEDSSELFIFNVLDGKTVVKMSQSSEESLSCGAFNRDGTRFVCGGQKGQFFYCDLNGTILESWEGVRVNGVAFRADNKTILASDNHYRIRGYNFNNPRTDFDILKESHAIMSFTLNSADRLVLLNIANQGLHLWDMEDKCLVRRFQGIRQSNFAIHSCFGGINESFVASGSEDKHVCIWHVKREEPLAKLTGHTKSVNCVSWNPVYPSILASCSDDATVRIWGPKTLRNNATPESDDCSSCSSSSSWNMTS